MGNHVIALMLYAAPFVIKAVALIVLIAFAIKIGMGLR